MGSPPSNQKGGAPAKVRMPHVGLLGAQFLDPGTINVPVTARDIPPAPDIGPWQHWAATFTQLHSWPGPPPVPINSIHHARPAEVDSAQPFDTPRVILPVVAPALFGEERVDFRYDFNTRFR